MKFILSYLIAISTFIFATLATWYEGSTIIDDPWEWNYSADFTRLGNEENITSSSQISQLDHFIYAAKFKPTFPVLMVLSFTFILMMTAYLLTKRRPKMKILFHVLLGSVLLFIGFLIQDSPTLGGKLFTWFFILCSSANIILVLILLGKSRRRKFAKVS
ncbi:YjdJ family protein [Aquibacillus kalidii]|uniref:YjdJ family protein n=1 Tax=Aquibacillus kalidii TaxID=2762597 RepID=UPI001649716D|nr:YjdJ family protein [Aquibacillus kalidii]